ncbi:MAG: hypothetical protein JNN17_11065 [Verrucomicrobiaceae bacterium]|nr:hypothetical protein [Verrucomicrobiaceae bacterium]
MSWKSPWQKRGFGLSRSIAVQGAQKAGNEKGRQEEKARILHFSAIYVFVAISDPSQPQKMVARI